MCVIFFVIKKGCPSLRRIVLSKVHTVYNVQLIELSNKKKLIILIQKSESIQNEKKK